MVPTADAKPAQSQETFRAMSPTRVVEVQALGQSSATVPAALAVEHLDLYWHSYMMQVALSGLTLFAITPAPLCYNTCPSLLFKSMYQWNWIIFTHVNQTSLRRLNIVVNISPNSWGAASLLKDTRVWDLTPGSSFPLIQTLEDISNGSSN